MTTRRIEVRLGEEDRRMLAQLADRRGCTLSDEIRALIKAAYLQDITERRKGAAARIAALNIEDVPDPDELSKQLAETYEPGGLC